MSCVSMHFSKACQHKYHHSMPVQLLMVVIHDRVFTGINVINMPEGLSEAGSELMSASMAEHPSKHKNTPKFMSVHVNVSTQYAYLRSPEIMSQTCWNPFQCTCQNSSEKISTKICQDVCPRIHAGWYVSLIARIVIMSVHFLVPNRQVRVGVIWIRMFLAENIEVKAASTCKNKLLWSSGVLNRCSKCLFHLILWDSTAARGDIDIDRVLYLLLGRRSSLWFGGGVFGPQLETNSQHQMGQHLLRRVWNRWPCFWCIHEFWWGRNRSKWQAASHSEYPLGIH